MIRVLVFRVAYRLIGFRAGLSLLGCQQDRTKKGQCDCTRPVLLYSRSTALELLLSIALREASVRQSGFYHPLFVHDKNGLLFVYKVVPFSLIILMSVFSKWVLFR